MPIRFRLWEKKRGDRRTVSPVLGTAGEAIFFGALLLFGSLALAALVKFGPVATGQQVGRLWLWLVGMVLASLIFIGLGGLVYTLLRVGTTAERRGALAKRAKNIDLLADALPSPRDFPTVPRDVNLTNSPGIKLAYRLPIARSPGWQAFGLGVFSLVWNGLVAALSGLAISKYYAGNPDWYLTALVIPFAVVGVGALYYWLRLLFLTAAIGPTSLEISDHPIHPGRTYQVYLTQAGRLRVKSLVLTLVCDEEASYRQGTDTRTESRRVFKKVVFSRDNFEILPDIPYEHLCNFELPTDVMHSFQSDHNAVLWRLIVQGTVEKWSSFERIFPIIVHPTNRPAGTITGEPSVA